MEKNLSGASNYQSQLLFANNDKEKNLLILPFPHCFYKFLSSQIMSW